MVSTELRSFWLTMNIATNFLLSTLIEQCIFVPDPPTDLRWLLPRLVQRKLLTGLGDGMAGVMLAQRNWDSSTKRQLLSAPIIGRHSYQ